MKKISLLLLPILTFASCGGSDFISSSSNKNESSEESIIVSSKEESHIHSSEESHTHSSEESHIHSSEESHIHSSSESHIHSSSESHIHSSEESHVHSSSESTESYLSSSEISSYQHFTIIDDSSESDIYSSIEESSDSYSSTIYESSDSSIEISESEYSSISSIVEESSSIVETSIKEEIYEIKYDLLGGKPAIRSDYVGLREEYIIPSTIPVREGYIFLGWNCIYSDSIISPESSITTAMDVTFFAVWGYECEECNGEGKVMGKIPCENCSSTGKVKEEQTGKCPDCSGGGYQYYDNIPCSTCLGTGHQFRGQCFKCHSYWYTYDPSDNICRSCYSYGGMNIIGQCPSCNAVGKAKHTCYTCKGLGKGTFEVDVDCPSCSGEGKVPGIVTCEHCLGETFERENGPTVNQVTSYSITLAKSLNYEYAISTERIFDDNSLEFQDSNVFKNLEEETTYYLYQRMKTHGSTPFSLASLPTIVTTLDYA